ncbi:hypothetical protein M404DRAFT_1000900 [Pisolithus tinctorius Marx 270]|uniref:Uncharacterized protein n=1 Tax=Pisolithus tinctorius Marx 270 TaxID=870435 RepID=A0A0C3P966_PISTI|nr:hypothetical protein M404DRAFT_1000900 [Pisolithus tinctorius Marx 270]
MSWFTQAAPLRLYTIQSTLTFQFKEEPNQALRLSIGKRWEVKLLQVACALGRKSCPKHVPLQKHKQIDRVSACV